MARRNLKRSLKCRVQKLEAQLKIDQQLSLRIGFLRELPADYTGEKHVVIVHYGEIEGGRQHCRFEERPGPAPKGPRDRVPWLPINPIDLRILGDPIDERDDTDFGAP